MEALLSKFSCLCGIGQGGTGGGDIEVELKIRDTRCCNCYKTKIVIHKDRGQREQREIIRRKADEFIESLSQSSRTSSQSISEISRDPKKK